MTASEVPMIPIQSKRAAALGACLALLCAVTTVRAADDPAAAQALFDLGKKLLAERKYAQACPKFEESRRLDPAIGTLLNLADCYEHQGRLAAAWATFLEASVRAKAAGQTERAQIGRDRAQALSARVAKLVVLVPEAANAPRLEVKRDGQLVGQAQWGVPIPLDAGEHGVVATAPGRRTWSKSLTVAEGGTYTVSVPELEPAGTAPAGAAAGPRVLAPKAVPPAAPPDSDGTQSGGIGAQKVLAIVSGVIGVAGVGAGSFFGLKSLSKHAQAKDACPDQCTNTADQKLWDDAVKNGNLSTVAFVVGGAGLAGGAVLWFTAGGGGKEEPPVQVGMGPGNLTLKALW
jgi:hypothetical protein